MDITTTPPSPYNIIEIILKQYKETSNKYETLLEKVVHLSLILKKIDNVPEYENLKRDHNDLQKEIIICINELNNSIEKKFTILNSELVKECQMIDKKVCSSLLSYKDEIDENVNKQINQIETKLVTRDTKIESALKTLNDVLIKLTYRLNLTIGLLALVSVIGSSAMLYVKYATNSIKNSYNKEYVTPQNNKQELYIIDSNGNKIPVVVKESGGK